MSDAPRILFVCLGNICRSPMAEGALRARAEAAGLDIDIESAGTGDWHIGKPPDERAIAEAASHDVDISGLRARQATADDFRRFTHIFALDEENLADLEAIRPDDAKADLALLMDEVDGEAGRPVADPYFGGQDGFGVTWSDVDSAARALVKRFGG